MVGEYVEQNISLRWSEESSRLEEFYKHSVPPGLSEFGPEA